MFEFYLLYWDEYEHKNKVATGFIQANGYGEAMQVIKEYFFNNEEEYMNDNAIKIHLNWTDNDGRIVLIEDREAKPGERDKG